MALPYRHLAQVLAFFLFFGISFRAHGSVVANIKLTAGGFEAKSTAEKVEGAKKSGNSYTAAKISLAVNSLDTGISLRNKHLHDRFKNNKQIVVSNIVAPKGKAGSATLSMNGVSKPIKFTHKEGGKVAQANFSLDLKDYNLGGNKYLGMGVEDQIEIEVKIPMSVFK